MKDLFKVIPCFLTSLLLLSGSFIFFEKSKDKIIEKTEKYQVYMNETFDDMSFDKGERSSGKPSSKNGQSELKQGDDPMPLNYQGITIIPIPSSNGGFISFIH